MSFTETFGGTTIYPSDVTYLPLALTANAELQWPLNASATGNIVARIIDVSASGAYSITMPPAVETAPGQLVQFTNLSAYVITIRNNVGGTILSIPAGTSWELYLTDNTTQAGLWRSLQYGSLVSQAQAAALAGSGLVATGALLSQSQPVTSFNSNYTLDDASRAGLYNWVGEAGTITLPSAVAVDDNWFTSIRNSGSGNLTLAPVGAETVNGAPSLVMTPGDSAFVISDGANFVTLGLGQNAVFAFDYTSIDLTGASGNYTLVGSELNRVSYTFVGVLAGNVQVIVPSTTQQYWVTNSTTGGSFTLQVRTVTQSPGIPVARGTAAILKCDGSNVSRAETAGIATPIAIADGGTGATTAGGALINFGGTATGIGLFTSASAAAAQTALGGTATGIAVFTSVDAAAARTAIGAGTGSGNGTVTSVDISGGTTGLFASGGPVTGSGTFTLDGALVAGHGGSGATSLTGILVGNGTSPFTTVTAPAGAIVGTTDTQTLTNKIITLRASSATSIASPLAWNSDNFDLYAATAQAADLTISADAGTPTDGRKILFRFTCDATIRTITFTGGVAGGFKPVGAGLAASGANFTYPLTASKTTYFGAIYNTSSSRWEIVALSQEA